MANSLDNYVKNVIAFTSAESHRELVELNRKALADVLEKHAGSLTQVLDTLNVEQHSLSFVTVLLAKLNNACSVVSSEKVEETLSQIEMSLPFFEKSQLLLAPDLFIKLFRKVFQLLLQRVSQIHRGIYLLANAINAIVSDPGELTSLHSCLFCLCLKAKIFEPALPFLEAPVSKILKEVPGEKLDRGYMDSRSVLLYFYYGGLILGALGRMEDCLLMMQNTLCIPALLTSAIMIQAYKKYLLISLVLHGTVKPLPGYRAVVVQKLAKRYCCEYQALENMCTPDSPEKDPAKEILAHLQNYHALFQKDGNVGLVKRIVRKVREAAIIKLSKTFLTVSLTDVARRCRMDDRDHAERYLTDMNAEGKICATLDKERDLVHFEEPKVDVNEETLDAAVQAGMNLTTLLKSYDARLRTNPTYISRSTKASALSVHDDEGFQQGTSGLNIGNVIFQSVGANIPSFELNIPS